MMRCLKCGFYINNREDEPLIHSWDKKTWFVTKFWESHLMKCYGLSTFEELVKLIKLYWKNKLQKEY